MSASFYCDTSALVKLYHQEVGTERMEELFSQEENVLVISELAIVEFYSTLARKVRIGEITPEAQEEARRNFEADCRQRFVVVPLGSSVIQKAKELLQKYGNNKALRTHCGRPCRGGPGREPCPSWREHHRVYNYDHRDSR